MSVVLEGPEETQNWAGMLLQEDFCFGSGLFAFELLPGCCSPGLLQNVLLS